MGAPFSNREPRCWPRGVRKRRGLRLGPVSQSGCSPVSPVAIDYGVG
jgi:hypothetical protein